jgi:DNA-binding MarR family transcriptional regulator
MGEDHATASSPDDLVSAYHRFRRADADLHARVRAVTGMSENELRVLQYLLASKAEGHDVMPTELTRQLGITSASTTALLDRLERSGALERVNNPSDRRSVLIAPTPAAETILVSTLDEYERRLEALSRGLDADERAAVSAFLDSLADAAAEIALDRETAAS